MKQYEKFGSFKTLENGLEVYSCEHTWQGFVFKDEERFLNEHDKVCYVQEYGLFDESNIKHELDDDDFYELTYGGGYTRKDFEKIVDTGDISQEEIDRRATILFEMVDWQSPETLYDELEFEDFEEEK